MPPVRHVIFDLDGTLVDSLPGIEWSVEEALAKCGFPPLAHHLKPLIGPPIRSILATVTSTAAPETLDWLERAFRASYDSAGWRIARVRQGVPDLLWLLQTGGVGLWVVTNKPAQVTLKILRELKLDGFFEEVACRDSETPPFRSKAEVLRDLLKRRALQPAACLMVGDTLEDFHAAAACDIRCAIVPDGYGSALPAGCRPVSGWEEIADMCDVAVYAVER